MIVGVKWLLDWGFSLALVVTLQFLQTRCPRLQWKIGGDMKSKQTGHSSSFRSVRLSSAYLSRGWDGLRWSYGGKSAERTLTSKSYEWFGSSTIIISWSWCKYEIM